MLHRIEDHRPYDVVYRRLDAAFAHRVQRGEVIAHEELLPVVGEPEVGERYYDIVRRWAARYQRETKIAGKFLPGVGWEFFEAERQLDHAGALIGQAARRTRRAVKIVGLVCDDEAADPGTRDRANRVLEAAQKFKLAMCAERDAVVRLLSPTSTMPRPAEEGSNKT